MTRTSAIRVRTRFESVDDFVVGYSPFFDARGVFIRTRRVQELGTRMRFELQLADGRPVFRGEGVVDEVREPPISASGMHVRISKLDRNSKTLFERMTGDLLHVGQDPFEAPTYDPDRPNLIDPETARLLGRGAEPEPAPVPEPELEPPPHEARHETRASASYEGDEGFGEGSPLDANVLGEIAEGIEFSLDAVWAGAVGESGGPADLGGYFGSPQALIDAGLTPVAGQPAVAGDWAHAELDGEREPFVAPEPAEWDAEAEAPQPDDEAPVVEAAWESDVPVASSEPPEWGGAAAAPDAAEPQWSQPESPVLELAEPVHTGPSGAFELDADDAFNLSSPGAENLEEPEAIELHDEVREGELAFGGPHDEEVDLELGLHEEIEAAGPLPDVFASGAFDTLEEEVETAPAVPDVLASGAFDTVEEAGEDADLFDVSMEPAGPEDAGDLGLGDHALAMASNYAPPTEAGPADTPAEEVFEADFIEPEPEPEPAPAPEPPAPSPRVHEPVRLAAPTAEEPDLHALASATLEHDVGHLRYSFASGESSGLNSLLSGLIDSSDEHEVPPEIDIAALTGEFEAQQQEGGPDAIDELLARESAAEGKEIEKKGLIGRLFGRKKR